MASTGLAAPAPGRTTAALSELQIPGESILTAEAEWDLGRRIRVSLGRLRRGVLRHPRGLERARDRVASVAAGEVHVLAWSHLKERIGSDARALARQLTSARRAGSRGDAGAARRAIESGAARLDPYPFSPERLMRWATELTTTRANVESPLDDRPEVVRLTRLLARELGRLRAARDRLAASNARLVLQEALRHRPRGLSREDLFQEGYLGVQRAALRFDPDRGLRFSTYASHWLRRSINDSFNQKSRVIRVPDRAQSNLRRHEAGESTPLDASNAERLRRVLHQTAFFSASDEDGGHSLAEVPSGRPDPVAHERFLRTLPDVVHRIVDGLPERERRILRCRFGFDGGARQTLDAIGETLDLSRERVRQLESSALRSLRSNASLAEYWQDLLEHDSAHCR